MKKNTAKLYRINRMKARFKRVHGYDLNLEDPQTLSEKIQWMKLSGNLEKLTKYVDKYEVRQFVRETIGEQYLIPSFGVYESVNEIDLKMLPKSFVMKATHGSNMNSFITDKSSIDWDKEKRRLNELLNINFYKRTGQPNYKNIKGRILIEEFLRDPSGDLLNYKFFCFHGKPKYVLVVGEGFTKGDIYDMKWNRIPARYIFENFSKPLVKPYRLKKLITIVKKLSSGFPFVRVDLYYTNDRIYFGELTFTPANGFLKYKTPYFDKTLGQLLDLCSYENNV